MAFLIAAAVISKMHAVLIPDVGPAGHRHSATARVLWCRLRNAACTESRTRRVSDVRWRSSFGSLIAKVGKTSSSGAP